MYSVKSKQLMSQEMFGREQQLRDDHEIRPLLDNSLQDDIHYDNRVSQSKAFFEEPRNSLRVQHDMYQPIPFTQYQAAYRPAQPAFMPQFSF